MKRHSLVSIRTQNKWAEQIRLRVYRHCIEVRQEAHSIPDAFSLVLLALNFYLQAYASNELSGFVISNILLRDTLGVIVAIFCALVPVFLLGSILFHVLLKDDSERISYTQLNEGQKNSVMIKLQAYLFKVNLLVTGPFSLVVVLSGLIFTVDSLGKLSVFNSFIPWLLLVPSIFGVALTVLYLSFIETYLPSAGIMAASSHLNSFAICFNVTVALFINTIEASLGTVAADASFLLFVLRAIIPLVAILNNHTRTVFYSRSGRWFFNTFHFFCILLSFYHFLNTGYGSHQMRGFSHTMMFLVAAIGARQFMNLELTVSAKSLLKSHITVKGILAVVQLFDRAKNSIHVLQNPSVLNFYGIMNSYRELDDGFDQYLARYSKNSTDLNSLGTHFILYLFENLQSQSSRTDFEASILHLYYINQLNFNMYHLSILLTKVKSVSMDFAQGFTFYCVESIIQNKIEDVYHKRTNLNSEDKFYLWDKSDQKQTRSERGNSEAGLDIYLFVRSILMYEVFVKRMNKVIDLVVSFYDILSLMRPKISNIHNKVIKINNNRVKCEQMFDNLDEFLGEGSHSFHLLPCARFLMEVFNEKRKSARLLKRWRRRNDFGLLSSRGMRYGRVQSMALESQAVLVVSGNPSDLGHVTYFTRNSPELCRVEKSLLEGFDIGGFLGDSLKRAHRAALMSCATDPLTNQYFGETKERYIVMPQHRNGYKRVKCIAGVVPTISYGMSFVVSIDENKSDYDTEFFMVLGKNDNLVGFSENIFDHPILGGLPRAAGGHVSLISTQLESLVVRFRENLKQLRQEQKDALEDLDASYIPKNTNFVQDLLNKTGTIAPQPMISTFAFKEEIESPELSRQTNIKIPAHFSLSGLRGYALNAQLQAAVIEIEGQIASEIYIIIKPEMENLNFNITGRGFTSKIKDLTQTLHMEDASIVDHRIKLKHINTGFESQKLNPNQSNLSKDDSAQQQNAKKYFSKISRHKLPSIGQARSKDDNKELNCRESIGSLTSIAANPVVFMVALVHKKKLIKKEMIAMLLVQLVFWAFCGYSTGITQLGLHTALENMVLARKNVINMLWVYVRMKDLEFLLQEKMLHRVGVLQSVEDRYRNITTAKLPSRDEELAVIEKQADYYHMKFMQEIINMPREVGIKFRMHKDVWVSNVTAVSKTSISHNIDTLGCLRLLTYYVADWKRNINTVTFNSLPVKDFYTVSTTKLDTLTTKIASMLLVADDIQFQIIKKEAFSTLMISTGICFFLSVVLIVCFLFMRSKITWVYSYLSRLTQIEINQKKETLRRVRDQLEETSKHEQEGAMTTFHNQTGGQLASHNLPQKQYKYNRAARHSNIETTLCTCFGMLNFIGILFLAMQLVNIVSLVVLDDLSVRGDAKIATMVIMRFHMRLTVGCHTMVERLYSAALLKSKLKTAGNYTTDTRGVQTYLDEYIRNLRGLNAYAVDYSKHFEESRESFPFLFTPPSEMIPYKALGMTTEEIEAIGGNTLGESYFAFYRWVLFALQNTLLEVNNANETTVWQSFHTKEFIEFDFIRRHFMLESCLGFQNVFYKNLDKSMNRDKQVFISVMELELLCFLAVLLGNYYGLRYIGRQCSATLSSLKLLPDATLRNNVYFASLLKKLSHL